MISLASIMGQTTLDGVAHPDVGTHLAYDAPYTYDISMHLTK